ncbi:MAG: hypothetical protein ACP5JJ_11215 [Anaerolineae bacterium]
MMRVSRPLPCSRVVLAVALVVLAVLVAGCGLVPTSTPRASDAWSNGKLMGTAILNNPVALRVDKAGHAFLVWVGPEHELSFARLNENAEVVVQRSLDVGSGSAQKPQMVVDTAGGLHLTWLDVGEQGYSLFYARLSADGAVIQEATPLSLPGQRVVHSWMVLDPVGRTVEMFWSDGVVSRPGCHHAAVNWSGEVVLPAETLISDGLFPVAQVDQQGYIHLAWRADPGSTPQFRYAVYDPQRRLLGPEVVAGRPSMQMGMLGGPTAGAGFDGPRLGLDEDWVYVAWVLEMRERERQDFTFYVAFPQPELDSRDATDTVDYPRPQLQGEAVRVQGADPSATAHPQFLDGQPSRQLLACFTQTSGPGNVETLQIVATDHLPGGIGGQEIVNASRGASLRPNVVVDSNGHLHLAWIDTAGFERYHVVYASTSPRVRETLNRVTVYDVVNRVLNAVMSIFTALFFTPVVLVWVLVPVVWLVGFALVTHAGDVSDQGGGIALVVAMLLELGVKLFVFGDLLSRFPFASLFAPSLGLLVGRWLFPVLLAAVSAGLTWVYLRRARSQSLFAAYFIYAAIDSFVTLVVYVAVPMGV